MFIYRLTIESLNTVGNLAVQFAPLGIKNTLIGDFVQERVVKNIGRFLGQFLFIKNTYITQVLQSLLKQWGIGINPLQDRQLEAITDNRSYLD